MIETIDHSLEFALDESYCQEQARNKKKLRILSLKDSSKDNTFDVCRGIEIAEEACKECLKEELEEMPSKNKDLCKATFTSKTKNHMFMITGPSGSSDPDSLMSVLDKITRSLNQYHSDLMANVIKKENKDVIKFYSECENIFYASLVKLTCFRSRSKFKVVANTEKQLHIESVLRKLHEELKLGPIEEAEEALEIENEE